MPHWVFYHTSDAFQDETHKDALAKSVTELYGLYMPKFYVVINFIQVAPSSHYVGGERPAKRGKPFVRITVAHIHVNLGKEIYDSWLQRIDAALKPYVEDKGYDWEYHVEDTSRELWKINGLAPPEFRSEDEKVWKHFNEPVAPEDMEEARKKMARL